MTNHLLLDSNCGTVQDYGANGYEAPHAWGGGVDYSSKDRRTAAENGMYTVSSYYRSTPSNLDMNLYYKEA